MYVCVCVCLHRSDTMIIRIRSFQKWMTPVSTRLCLNLRTIPGLLSSDDRAEFHCFCHQQRLHFFQYPFPSWWLAVCHHSGFGLGGIHCYSYIYCVALRVDRSMFIILHSPNEISLTSFFFHLNIVQFGTLDSIVTLNYLPTLVTFSDPF